MSNNMYDCGYVDGSNAARKQMEPLVEAVRDAAYMFKTIEDARKLPPTADTQQQYVAMGRQLERLLRALDF
jgi:hypothetical protein